MTNQKEIHIPYLSQDEQIFLNTAATMSQYKRMSTQSLGSRPSMESNHPPSNSRRHQVVSMSSLSSFLFKKRASVTYSLMSSTSLSTMDFVPLVEDEYSPPHSPKAKELESLIFEQPQRTVRLSLTPRCAV